MKRKIILFITVFFLFSLWIFGEVRVREMEMNLPTYVTGPDDLSPPLWNLRVYPYPMQTDITRDKMIKSHRVIEMENDYIRILILPDLGGRILAALDKTNSDFDFIYYNHVIMPGLVALRGAWLSGGIEWNFPTLGHTVNTFSPVNHKILENADGSVTCVVGTEEWVRRMKWEVFITLFPDRSYFQTRIRLFNRTLAHNNGYFWANAATHAWPDTRVIFPPADYTFAGSRRNPAPWPVHDGKDVSWYKNTASAHDYFCGTPGDFNGSYNSDKDNGTAHYASRFESPGKKFWTWGTAPSGMIWEDLLTDEDGQYIEVQAGRLLTQGDTWIFEPHLIEEWDEWWYPLKKMQGFVTANPDAALNFELRDDGVFISLNTTRSFKDAEVRLLCQGETVFSEMLNIAPAGFYWKNVPVKDKKGVWVLEFRDRNGQKIIDYTIEKPQIPPPELQPSFPENKENPAEISFLRGYYALKHWNFEGAIHYFKQALERDSGLTPALRWLGILYYKTGKTKEALELFNKVLDRDEDDHTARYYSALSRKKLGIRQRTKEDLYLVSRRAAYRHVAPYVLASLELGEGDYAKACMLLREAIRNNPGDIKARVMLSAALRHLGERDESGRLVEDALDEDPISSLALVEKELLSGRSELGLLGNNPEYYIEVASDFLEMNLMEDAVRTLEIYIESENSTNHPFVYYYLGFLEHSLGHSQDASDYFTKASSCRPDYVFPFRVETESVLRLALKYNDTDWKASYYLGNLLTAKLRWEEGLEFFKKAEHFAPGFPVLYRNLGEIYWKKIKDHKKAKEMYEKAVSLSPEDFRLYVALDELYAINGDHSKRVALYDQAPQNVKKNFNYVLKRAQYYVDTGQPTKALEILKIHNFLPWEGWTGAREVFVLALLNRALSGLKEGKYRKALDDLIAAMEYPQNLGTGKPPHPVFIREYYYIGLCYEKMAKRELAQKYYKMALEEKTGSPSMNAYYQALALRGIGNSKGADDKLKEIKAKSEVNIQQYGRGNPRYFLWAAMASHALGEKIQAREYLLKAIELDPSNRWAAIFASESGILR